MKVADLNEARGTLSAVAVERGAMLTGTGRQGSACGSDHGSGDRRADRTQSRRADWRDGEADAANQLRLRASLSRLEFAPTTWQSVSISKW
jgi:hypothetical protein